MNQRIGKTIASALCTLLLASAGAFPAAAASSHTEAVPISTQPIARPVADPLPEPTISEEEALAILSRFVKQNPGKGQFEASLYTHSSGPVWSLSYTIREQYGSTSYGIGEIDAVTGRLLRLHVGFDELRSFTSISKENAQPEALARAAATALAREMYEGDFDRLREAPQDLAATYYGGWAGNTYPYTWILYENEIPVPEHRVHVSLDMETLGLVSFDASAPAYSLRDAEPKVPAAEALARMQAFMPELVYQPIYHQHTHAPSYRLVYRLRTAPYRIDAVSGEPLDLMGRPLPKVEAPETVPANLSVGVTPEALPLTSEQAIALSKRLLTPPESAMVDAHTDPRYSNIQIHWHSSFSDDGTYFSASASFDPATGLLLNAHRSSYGRGPVRTQPPSEPTAEQETAAKAAAIGLVQQYYSQVLDDLKLAPFPYRMSNSPYHFFFQRYLNGVIVEGDGVWVNLDPTTLEWTNLSASWTKASQLPAMGEVITAEAAQKKLLDGRDLRLIYQSLPRLEAFYYEPWTPSTVEYGLYYVWNDPEQAGMPFSTYVDAHTGDLFDGAGRPVGWWKEVNEAITGHWAESALRLAHTRGAIEPAADKLDAPLTREEALRLLVSTQRSYYFDHQTPPYTDVQPNTALYDYVMRALAAGWLQPEGDNPTFNAEAPITRAEFATWITRVLNLSELADSPLVTQSGFTDLETLTRSERNAVAFLEALGILDSGTAFRGSDPLSMAEGAVLFMRLLSH